jgi:catechol 2,3-dioxygenase-like lactoylglutathione lyase family enzyme
VLGHLGINVPDIGQAKAYFGEVMPHLGFERFLETDDTVAFMPAGGKQGTYLFVYRAMESGDYSRHRTGLQHLAFMVPTRSAVWEIRDRVAALGSAIVHEPQEFPQYPPPYFATFWLDPFGFMLEAVCHHDRD